jgi:hypothetical protein
MYKKERAVALVLLGVKNIFIISFSCAAISFSETGDFFFYVRYFGSTEKRVR